MLKFCRKQSRPSEHLLETDGVGGAWVRAGNHNPGRVAIIALRLPW